MAKSNATPCVNYSCFDLNDNPQSISTCDVAIKPPFLDLWTKQTSQSNEMDSELNVLAANQEYNVPGSVKITQW